MERADIERRLAEAGVAVSLITERIGHLRTLLAELQRRGDGPTSVLVRSFLDDAENRLLLYMETRDRIAREAEGQSGTAPPP